MLEIVVLNFLEINRSSIKYCLSPNFPFVLLYHCCNFTIQANLFAQDETKAQLLRMVHPEGDSEAELDAEAPLRASGCGRRLDGARLE